MVSSSIASRWRELSGEKNWEGLLHPLDLDLRRYLIHYCQRAGATAYAFNETKASKGYALSLYPPDEGIAVLGRRDIIVSWRGTITKTEWEDDAHVCQTSAKELFGSHLTLVHTGFYNIYMASIANSTYAKTSAREQDRKAVRKLVDKYQNEEVSIIVIGHSLGGALATLNAMDIAYNSFNKPTSNPDKAFMVTSFPIASPRVGNHVFKYICDRLDNFHILRIVNSTDHVPKVPLALGIYFHVGEELGIDTTKSPYLKPNVNPHNLEAHQHGIAGVQENGEFKLEEELNFDNAVINKYTDGLLDKCKIPDNWWTKELFKNMVLQDDGHWKYINAAYVPHPPNA